MRYFGKEVSELTLSECAVLAGITKSPNYYNPLKNPEASRERQELVLAKMLELEAIALHLFCLSERCIEVAKVLCVEECFHNYYLTCPSPSINHLYVVNAWSPIGPRGPSF